MLMQLWRCVEHGLMSLFSWEEKQGPTCERCGRPLERVEREASS